MCPSASRARLRNRAAHERLLWKQPTFSAGAAKSGTPVCFLCPPAVPSSRGGVKAHSPRLSSRPATPPPAPLDSAAACASRLQGISLCLVPPTGGHDKYAPLSNAGTDSAPSTGTPFCTLPRSPGYPQAPCKRGPVPGAEPSRGPAQRSSLRGLRRLPEGVDCALSAQVH